MNNYHNVLNAVYNQPWAIRQNAFDGIDQYIRARIKNGQSLDVEADVVALTAQRGIQSVAGGVAVIPISGPITHRPSFFQVLFGGVSVEGLKSQISAALDNSAVSAIVFDIDSPGGSVDGVPELAEFIRSNRGPKPMIGVANTLMASAAFWIGAQFDELVATPSALVGSIGVMAQHVDISELNAAMGVKVTTITNDSSPNKAAGNPNEPLSDSALDEIQGIVDTFAGMFEKAVAKGRGISVSKVRGDFGGGTIFNAEDAKTSGLVDRIGTLDETIARMAKARPRRGPQTQTRRMRLALANKG